MTPIRPFGSPRSRRSAGWAARRPRAAAEASLADPDRACARRRSGRSVPCRRSDAALETIPLVDELIVDPVPPVSAAIACLFGSADRIHARPRSSPTC